MGLEIKFRKYKNIYQKPTRMNKSELVENGNNFFLVYEIRRI